jgi:hypothetical protein
LLTFVAGTPADVFGGGFGDAVARELIARYRFTAAPNETPYHSEPVDGSGWRDLQKLAGSMLGESAPHLSKVEAYQAVYIPAPLTDVEHVAIANAADPLQVASLTALIDELTRFAHHASLPTDDLELMGLAARYLEDDEMIDKELDLQTYVQLMLTAKQAVARRQALWVVA